jgi:hypothetical protein
MSEQLDVPQSSSEERRPAQGKIKKTRNVSHHRKALLPIPEHEKLDESSGIEGHSYCKPVAMTKAELYLSRIQIENMSTFTAQFPSTKLTSECALVAAKMTEAYNQLNPKMDATSAAAAAAGAPKVPRRELADLSPAKRDLSDVQMQQLHYDQSQAPLIEVERIRQYEAQMLKPQYHLATRMLSDEEASSMLRHNLVSLPILTAQTEAMLMRQSGTFYFPQPAPKQGVYRTFPPCGMGRRCVGMDSRMGPNGQIIHSFIEGLDTPIIFCRAMTKEQLDELRRSDKQPTNDGWPCVLCHRRQTEQLVNQVRMGVPKGQQPITPALTTVYQLWKNLEDTEGGYHRKHMAPVRENEVVIAPLARFSARMLRGRFVPLSADPANPGAKFGFWEVTQEHTLFKPPTLVSPHIGETLQSFSRGASTRSINSAASATTPRKPASALPALQLTTCSASGSAASTSAASASMFSARTPSSGNTDTLIGMLRSALVGSPTVLPSTKET